ncbi:MAG: winged helix-turn-helix domain-containing protein, partial [Candidatus Heimdallarchaeota archaeon]
IENLLIHQSNQSDFVQAPLTSEEIKETHSTPLDVMELMKVLSKKDEHLIPTIKALFSSQEGGSAQDIAGITKRSRSRENQHLNNLVELGYVQKKRKGREIRFFLSH